MLKVRVMPTLLHKNVGLVKGVGYNSWRRVGSAMQSVKVYNMREVDELVFLDITATLEKRPPDFEMVDELADECFMPMAVGGGIRTLSDVQRLLHVGADKVVINTAALENPALIGEIARSFGSQCVVVSIDVKELPGGTYNVFSHAGTRPTGRRPEEWAKEVEGLGAGEILLTSIDRDGTMTGYDLAITKKVSEAVTIPVIASGGAGSYEHMRQAIITGGASAVAAASMFHFTDQTPLAAKKYLQSNGIKVRI